MLGERLERLDEHLRMLERLVDRDDGIIIMTQKINFRGDR